MVGASGGIAGVLGAYGSPSKAVIRTFLLFLIFIRFINLPAWVVLGIWIGGQFLAVPAALDSDGGGVAYFAHIGGFLAGMIFVPFSSAPMCPAGATRPMMVRSTILQRTAGRSAQSLHAERHNPMRSRISSRKHEALSDALPFMTNAPPARAKASLPCPADSLGHIENTSQPRKQGKRGRGPPA